MLCSLFLPLKLVGEPLLCFSYSDPASSFERGPMCPGRVRFASPIGTPLEAMSGGLYPLFELHIPLVRREVLLNLAFKSSLGSKV